MQPGPLMLDLQGEQLLPEEEILLKHPQVGGVIFFARNFSSTQQITELTRQIRAVRPDLLICVDQEGGRVQRFKTGFTRIPPMQLLGDLFDSNNPDAAKVTSDIGWLMASELIACGLDFSFAPVLDVDRDSCEVIANRAFSDDPAMVAKAAEAFIKGMAEAGMSATGKHFPGHGGVALDSHLATPYDERLMEQLVEKDLIPFQQLSANLQGIMPAHIVFPNIDDNSVGFSPFWLQTVLRKQLGFDGVIFSDDLSMKGADVVGGYIDKAEQALNAGCDMILVCNNREGALQVLDYLDERNTEPSERLSRMRTAETISWHTLRQTSRWQSATASADNLLPTK